MTAPETTLLISLAFLSGKHFLGDFVLQNGFQLRHKARYGHPGGLLHVGIHGGLTLPLFFILPGMGVWVPAFVVLAEMAAHYHIDWGKERILRITGWQHHDRRYWRLFGLDQLLHLLSYLLMAAFVVQQVHGG